jgi:hypothetical protein
VILEIVSREMFVEYTSAKKGFNLGGR